MKQDQALLDAGQAAHWICRLCGKKVVTQIRPDHPLRPVLIPRSGGGALFVHQRCAQREAQEENEKTMKSTDVRQTMHTLQEAAAARSELAAISDLVGTVDGLNNGPLSARIATLLEAFLTYKEAALAAAKKKTDTEMVALTAEKKKSQALSTELALVKEQMQDLLVQRDVLQRRVDAWDKEAKKLAYIQTAIRVATGLEELPADG